MPDAAFHFDPKLHQYSVNGEVQPHCTGILQRMGIIDYSGVPEFTLKRKTLIGDLVHKATQHIDVDGLSIDLALGAVIDAAFEDCEFYNVAPDDCAPYLKAHQRFTSESGFECLFVEERCVAVVNGMRFGMTIDRGGKLSGKHTILDLKCCHGKEKSWPVQLAGYALGLPKPPKVSRWERANLWLKPDETYQILPGGRTTTDRTVERRDEEVFLAALRVAWWTKENYGRF